MWISCAFTHTHKHKLNRVDEWIGWCWSESVHKLQDHLPPPNNIQTHQTSSQVKHIVKDRSSPWIARMQRCCCESNKEKEEEEEVDEEDEEKDGTEIRISSDEQIRGCFHSMFPFPLLLYLSSIFRFSWTIVVNGCCHCDCCYTFENSVMHSWIIVIG